MTPARRLDARIAAWDIDVERLVQTAGSIIAFGRQHHRPVVLKMIRNRGEEWRSGPLLDAFDGRGVVRAIDHVDGAVLLERLQPGDPLASMSVDGRDEQATAILADVIARMSPHSPAVNVATAQDWGQGFDRYRATAFGHIPQPLIEAAQRVYSLMCASQSRPRLLHGDLHHHNVLRDSERGWLAIDPKGVIGEPEYEIGAALRNPVEYPNVFATPSVIERRVERFAKTLRLNSERILAWGFAQAVLAAVWSAEDAESAESEESAEDAEGAEGAEHAEGAEDHPWIVFASNIRPMLKGIVDV